ncbi:LysR family transcriptional regulator [Nocardia sp. NBC_01499]|uniref:LysR family transcriptional regulator n=1 Tax=Nocardia sp. NBC_01499 TaxID=2903597 RepID=UPI0038689396
MKLASFDLNLLVALDALLAEESVSRAAERLRIGQPAMSATLTRLRSVLGDPVLVRVGRAMERTVFAESLREPLAEILHDVELLLNSGTAFDPATSRRSFTIAASDYVTLMLLRPLIERLSTIAPEVSLRVIPGDAGMLENVRRGLIDLAIYPAELLPMNLPFRTEKLFTEDFVCVTAAANPDVGEELTVEQLSTLPYLAAAQGALASLADQRLDEAQIPRNTTMTAQSFVLAPFLLPGTRMYTIIQRRLAALLMDDARFRTLQPPIPIAAVHELLIWSPRRTADAGHDWLRAQLHNNAELLT